jgi:hypothetical protein
MDKLKNTSLGLWGDNPRSELLSQDFWDRFADELRFDLLAVMIDRSDKDPTYTYQPRHVEKLLELADPSAVEIVLTTWPYPDKDQIDKQCEQMEELMKVGPVAAWEVDLEFNWKVKHVRDFDDLDLAGDYLVKRMREVCAIQDARFEVTSFTQHTENSKRADVAPECDRVLVQAYSVANRNDKPVSLESRYSPGNMQAFTLDRTIQIPGVDTENGPRLGVGLAAWDQRFVGLSARMAMLQAVQASLLYDPIDIRWWSSKHVIGKRANPYAFSFLSGLRGES